MRIYPSLPLIYYKHTVCAVSTLCLTVVTIYLLYRDRIVASLLVMTQRANTQNSDNVNVVNNDATTLVVIICTTLYICFLLTWLAWMYYAKHSNQPTSPNCVADKPEEAIELGVYKTRLHPVVVPRMKKNLGPSCESV